MSQLVLSFFTQYAGVNIGPVHKKDIMRASVMLEHDAQLVGRCTPPPCDQFYSITLIHSSIPIP